MTNYNADMHIHSKYSFDSKMDIKEIIQKLEEKKLKYLALTDHIEFATQPVGEVIHRIKHRNEEIDELQSTTNIKIIKGVEISEPHLYESEVEYLNSIEDLDYVIGSIHHIYRMPLRKMSHLRNAYSLYYQSMLKMVSTANIDTLAHMDYIKKSVSRNDYDPEIITEILKTIIARNIALEINTSGMRRCGEYFPSEEIINQYISLGGKNIVYGSDAHTLNELYDNIPEATEDINPLLNPGIIVNHNFRSLKK